MNTKHKIMIVDDEANICLFLSLTLSDEYTVLTASNFEQAKVIMEENDISLALVDLILSQENGLDILQYIKREYPLTVVIMITAFGDIATSVKAIHMGAYNYLQKPINVEELRVFIHQALEFRKMSRRLDQLNGELEIRNSYGNMVGRSHSMQKVYGMIDKLKDVDTNVLITGESGTGKELVARAIHYSGTRKNKPFIATNCAAIPAGLLEEEFFGHKKGTFTGAFQDTIGKLELSDGGTFFLDEVSELPLELQGKLLRVIQEKETRPIGANEYKKIDVHFIAATNQDLKKMVEKKLFREDLFYRLNVVEIKMPPLRERVQDIPLLCDEFLRKLSSEKHHDVIGISKPAEAVLMKYDYHGNVRELFNIIEYAIVLCDGKIIEVTDLPESVLFNMNKGESSANVETIVRDYLLGQNLKDIEKAMIKVCLEDEHISKRDIAEKLGISERCLFYKIKEYSL